MLEFGDQGDINMSYTSTRGLALDRESHHIYRLPGTVGGKDARQTMQVQKVLSWHRHQV